MLERREKTITPQNRHPKKAVGVKDYAHDLNCFFFLWRSYNALGRRMLAMQENHSEINFRRRLLSTTLTLEHAMRALAHIGVICQWMPKA